MNWLAKLEKTKKDLEKTINLEKRKLMMEKEMVSFQKANLERKIEEVAELEEELEEFRKEKEEIKKLEEEKLSLARFLQDVSTRISKIKKANEEIQERGKEIDTKTKLLENPEPFCPICHKEMRYDQKVSFKNKLTEQGRYEKELIRKNLEQLGILQKKKESNENELKEIERKILAKPLVFEKASVLEEKISDVKGDAKKLGELEKREGEINKTLKERSYALMAQKLLKEVLKEIKKNL